MTELLPGTTYTATIRVGLNQPPDIYTGLPYLFIDYNNDNDFTDPGEALTTTATCGQGNVSYQFTTPSTIAVANTWLHFRVVVVSCYQGVVPTGCVNPSNAQVEDFSVFFKQVVALPVSLISFNGHAARGGNELLWVMTSSDNTDYFEVERSNNGADFK